MASMLTTIDNPFDPFTQWDEWYAWDSNAKYYTTSYLARMVQTSLELSEYDQDLAIEHAIDRIVELNLNGLYKKVVK
jgi:hypothetical protein